MRPFTSSAAVLTAVLAWLILLFWLQPFTRINQGLDLAFAALPSWTQVDNLYVNPEVQEVSRGDHPLRSFQMLKSSWTRRSTATRIVLMGNSQTQAVSLASGENPPSEPEKTYTDLIADRFRGEGDRALFYRLSAGALSYEEMLWYATYFTAKAELKPDIVLVQLNYQNFVNGNIRTGLLELLADNEFRKSIEKLCWQNTDADGFREALRNFEENRIQASRRTALERSSTLETGGYIVETRLRQALDRSPRFRQRGDDKQAAVLMLLRCRSYFLHLQQATPRSLKGPRIDASRAALESLILCLQHAGIQVILFQAPTNPRVPLYRTAEDDRAYHAFADRLAKRYKLTILDFEHSIPAQDWGMALNAPDPLHLGRTGHRMLASLIAARLERTPGKAGAAGI